MKPLLQHNVLESSIAERPVLLTAPLRRGFKRHSLSRYGDISWDLGPAVFRDNTRRCHRTVHFGEITDPLIAASLKEYLFARLNIDLPGCRLSLPPTSLRQAFNRARRFFDFVKEQIGAFDLTRVDQPLLDLYVKTLRKMGVSPVGVMQLLDVIFDLHVYRAHLSLTQLTFEPWPGRQPAQVAGYRFHREENRTPRISEPIISAMLRAALFYVNHFSADILAARQELSRLEEARDAIRAKDATLTPAKRRARQLARLSAYLRKRQRQGRGVPIWTVEKRPNYNIVDSARVVPNWHLLQLHAGIDVTQDPSLHLQLSQVARQLVRAALERDGTEPGGMDTPISAHPDTGVPWRDRFTVITLHHEERMLQAACYIVCAYLTGMRDCEVQAMQRGCLTVSLSEDGIVTRYRVRSTAFKRKVRAGTREQWITIEPVAKAIRVLERLARHDIADRTSTLWPVLHTRRGGKTHISAEVVNQLNQFRNRLATLFDPATLPTELSIWRFTTRQFRRTIAWHIANRPFGTVAGMIQYKHASVATFEGYAGQSRSGFRAEVESERALGQMDDILSYFDARKNGQSITGPAARRIGAALDSAAQSLDALPAMVGDRSRLRSLLASTARTLYVGVLADCFLIPQPLCACAT